MPRILVSTVLNGKAGNIYHLGCYSVHLFLHNKQAIKITKSLKVEWKILKPAHHHTHLISFFTFKVSDIKILLKMQSPKPELARWQ